MFLLHKREQSFLILGELRLLSSSNEGKEVCFTQHLHMAYSGIEIYLNVQYKYLEQITVIARTARHPELTWFRIED